MLIRILNSILYVSSKDWNGLRNALIETPSRVIKFHVQSNSHFVIRIYLFDLKIKRQVVFVR